jgi:hypothetical protein
LLDLEGGTPHSAPEPSLNFELSDVFLKAWSFLLHHAHECSNSTLLAAMDVMAVFKPAPTDVGSLMTWPAMSS